MNIFKDLVHVFHVFFSRFLISAVKQAAQEEQEAKVGRSYILVIINLAGSVERICTNTLVFDADSPCFVCINLKQTHFDFSKTFSCSIVFSFHARNFIRAEVFSESEKGTDTRQRRKAFFLSKDWRRSFSFLFTY